MTLLVMAAALLLQDAPVEWSRFGSGSWTEHLTTGKREGTELRTVEKSFLKESSDTDIILSVETVDAGGGRSEVDMRFPLPRRAVKEDEGKKTGQEKLTIDGREFACDIFERAGVKRWVCP